METYYTRLEALSKTLRRTVDEFTTSNPSSQGDSLILSRAIIMAASGANPMAASAIFSIGGTPADRKSFSDILLKGASPEDIAEPFEFCDKAIAYLEIRKILESKLGE